MAIWVTPQDVLNRWLGGNPPAADSAALLTLIDDAEDAVLELFPKIQGRIDGLSIPLARVVRIVSNVVIRAYKSGQEFRQSYSEATGPFSQSASYSEGAGRFIYLTDDEIKSLSPDRGGKAFTVSMAPQATSRRAWWNDGRGFIND